MAMNLRNVELDILCAKVFLCPECNRERDAPKGIHRLSAHSGEWTRGSQSGPWDLQLPKRSVADDVEPSPTVDQNMMQLDVGNDMGGDERQYADPCHVLGAVYRWPFGTNTMGQPRHYTKKHGPGTTRPG
jgi:hypothetical protein